MNIENINDSIIVGEEVVDIESQDCIEISKKRKLTSSVWNEFERAKNKDGGVIATCLHCRKALCGDSTKGTTHLKNHLKRCTRRVHTSKGQQHLSLDGTQTSLPQPKIWKFDQEKCRRSFAIAVVKHNYPFNICEHEYFREFLSNLQPIFKMISRNTLRSDLLTLYEEEKRILYNFLDKQQCRFSLTTDLWTSEHQNIAYICLTCHFIDSDWVLHKKMLAYRRFDFPHDADSLQARILELIMEWNIDKKLNAIVVDNAANNDGMIKSLKTLLCTKGLLIMNGDLFHVRCSAHILNLVVQDGLKSINGTIENIRSTVKYLHRSTHGKQKFDNVVSQLKLNAKKKVPLDVPHRWNSTYLMLEAALELREAFERFANLPKVIDEELLMKRDLV